MKNLQLSVSFQDLSFTFWPGSRFLFRPISSSSSWRWKSTISQNPQNISKLSRFFLSSQQNLIFRTRTARGVKVRAEQKFVGEFLFFVKIWLFLLIHVRFNCIHTQSIAKLIVSYAKQLQSSTVAYKKVRNEKTFSLPGEFWLFSFELFLCKDKLELWSRTTRVPRRKQTSQMEVKRVKAKKSRHPISLSLQHPAHSQLPQNHPPIHLNLPQRMISSR